MRFATSLPSTVIAGLLLLFAAAVRAQAPPSIQFFMPDGSLPPHELRLSLTTDDGRVDTFFTDSKGKFHIVRALGLRADAGYTITVEGDGRTFETTSVSFKLYNVYYIPVFLKPLRTEGPPSHGQIEVLEVDAAPPSAAREAYQQGLKHLQEGDAPRAAAAFQAAVDIHPRYQAALNDLGVCYLKMGRLEEASESLERAVEAAPRVYYSRLNLALVRNRQGRPREAIELLESIRRQYPRLAEVRMPLAEAFVAAGHLREAEPLLREILAERGLEREKRGETLYRLGLLLNRTERFAEAARELSRAAKLQPSDARTRLQLGAAQLQLRRLKDAEKELQAAYRLGGKAMGAAQLLLGQAYFLQNKHARALEAFQQYLTDVPQAPNESEVRGVIEQLKAALRPPA